MPESGLKPLEELFRAWVIRFLVDKGLMPPRAGSDAFQVAENATTGSVS
jgi:hypothetical protein